MKATTTPKYIKVSFGYDKTFILPQQTASKLMGLLEEGEELLNGTWSLDNAKLKPDISFTMEPITFDDIQLIRKAQIAGITYKEYKDTLEGVNNEDDKKSTGGKEVN